MPSTTFPGTHCTSALHFLDTNILICAVSTAIEEVGRPRRALDLLTASNLVLSVQVLQEFHVQSTRTSRPEALTHDEAVVFIASLQRFPVQTITRDVMHAALAIRERCGLSCGDSATLAVAHAYGCDAVYTEGLSTEQDYDGVRVINPFTCSPHRFR